MPSHNPISSKGQKDPPGVENMVRSETGEETKAVQNGISSDLKTLRSILHTLETNSDIVYSVNGLIEVRDNFREHIHRVEKLISEMKDSLISYCSRVGDALRNYGVMVENSDIIIASNMREYSLRHQPEREVITRARALYRYAMDNISTLCFFGVSIETMNNFDNAINKLAYASGVACDNFFIKPAWQKDVDRKLDETYAFVFETLDAYVDGIKDRYPQFYAEYTSVKSSLSDYYRNKHN